MIPRRIFQEVFGVFLKWNELAIRKMAFGDGNVRLAAKAYYSKCGSEEGYARHAEATLANKFHQYLVSTGAREPDRAWTRPILEWDFEHVILVSAFPEALENADKRGNWGTFLGMRPLGPDTLFSHMFRTTYHKPDSPFLLSLQRRRELKKTLGKGGPTLVNECRRLGKKDFLSEMSLRPDNRKLIKTTHTAEGILSLTGYTPDEFWREVRRPGSVTPIYSLPGFLAA